jgi:hypothetical protein
VQPKQRGSTFGRVTEPSPERLGVNGEYDTAFSLAPITSVFRRAKLRAEGHSNNRSRTKLAPEDTPNDAGCNVKASQVSNSGGELAL